jgi:hypothetical protein
VSVTARAPSDVGPLAGVLCVVLARKGMHLRFLGTRKRPRLTSVALLRHGFAGPSVGDKRPTYVSASGVGDSRWETNFGTNEIMLD